VTKELAQALEFLADEKSLSLISVNRTRRVSSRQVIPDGRSRQKIWKELLSQGYLEKEEDGSAEVPFAMVTNKSICDRPRLPDFSLGMEYDKNSRHFDARQDESLGGLAYVYWHGLELDQKCEIIRRLEEDLDYCKVVWGDPRNTAAGFTVLPFGESPTHPDRMIVVGVSSVSTQQVRDTKAKQHLAKTVAGNIPSSYLKRIGVIEDISKAPIPTDCVNNECPGLSANVYNWEYELPIAIKANEDRIKETQETIERLIALGKHVETIGGWDQLHQDFRQQVDKIVEKRFKPTA
jgi:hypothetical protein